MKLRPGDQPLPVPNDSRDIQAPVMEDIARRRQTGIERYGTPLQAHNGRDALRDAYEEALDLAMYLRQLIEEEERLIVAVTPPDEQDADGGGRDGHCAAPLKALPPSAWALPARQARFRRADRGVS